MEETAADDHAAAGRHTEAIKIYTHCLLRSNHKNPGLLLKRANTFLKFAKLVSTRPCAEADRDRKAGPDSHTLAALALRDANKLLDVDHDAALKPTIYLLRGRALHILEEHVAAHDSFYEGLTHDPVNAEICRELERLDSTATEDEAAPALAGSAAAGARSGTNRSVARSTRTDMVAGPASASGMRRKSTPCAAEDFDCSLCSSLLLEPVTTACGHTFCRECLVRSLDYGNRCPMCRCVLHMTARKHPLSVTIQNVITRHFGNELVARKKLQGEHSELQGENVLPIFAIDYVCPGQLMALNVFEPRYRLMARRCLDGDRKFGMIGVGHVPVDQVQVGTEVEILESRQLHDGRYHLQIQAKRRFVVVREWQVDGYRCSRVQYYRDGEPLPNPSTEETASPHVSPADSVANAASTATCKHTDDSDKKLSLDATEPRLVPCPSTAQEPALN
eukprot:SAG31_NODE_3564_length_4120_cov_2.575479_1_plen_447_part_10